MNDTQIKNLIGEQPLSMYRLANVVSEVLGERIREQQFYNYRKNGRVKVNAEGRIAPKDALEFVKSFVQRREERAAAKEAKESEEQDA